MRDPLVNAHKSGGAGSIQKQRKFGAVSCKNIFCSNYMYCLY